MYKHLVLWKLKTMAYGKDRAENSNLLKEKIESLKNSIPEIQFLDVGINNGKYAASFFDIGMYITFKNKADFLKYINYQSHNEVVVFIQSVIENEEIVDFESEEL